MARPVLTEYLLKLSTNETEYERFRRSKADATQSMREAGLSERHQEVLLRGNFKELHEAVVEELSALRPSGMWPMTLGGPVEEATVPIHFTNPYTPSAGRHDDT